MVSKGPLKIGLSDQLIRQYKEALADLSDIRLIILLVFDSFEEIMRSYAAWRLSCDVDEVPFEGSQLFNVVLIGKSTKELRNRTEAFKALRNKVAHKFHRKEYESKLKVFVEKYKIPYPHSNEGKRKALTEAVATLVLDIANSMGQTPPRGDFPLPILSLELSS